MKAKLFLILFITTLGLRAQGDTLSKIFNGQCREITIDRAARFAEDRGLSMLTDETPYGMKITLLANPIVEIKNEQGKVIKGIYEDVVIYLGAVVLHRTLYYSDNWFTGERMYWNSICYPESQTQKYLDWILYTEVVEAKYYHYTKLESTQYDRTFSN